MKTKTAIIPGASRPIGRAIARQLAQRNINLVLPCYDWPESIQELKDEAKSFSSKCVFPQVNLQEKKEVKALMTMVKKEFGSVNYLVNNIERGGMPIVHGSYDNEQNSQQWELEINTTMKAKWLLFHHCHPLLKKGGTGAVVNISSISAITGRSGPAALFFNDGYSAANRAISAFTQTWAREMGSSFRVNELMLGFCQSRHGENTRGWEALSNKEKEGLINHTLLERTCTPEEVAKSVCFLLFDATYMTGSTICMDGGYLLGGDKVPDYPDGIL